MSFFSRALRARWSRGATAAVFIRIAANATLPRRSAVLLISLLTVTCARAHEPFDISSRIVVHGEHIELTSTLGLDAARQLLTAAAVAPEKIAQAVQARGPDEEVEHPLQVAQHFLALAVDDVPLAATRVTSVSEGMEVILRIGYARPPGRSLSIHARCYETIPELRRGVLQVVSDVGGKLGAALFSPKNRQLSVTLKAAANAPLPPE